MPARRPRWQAKNDRRSSFGQLFGFGYPGYGGTLNLQLLLKNHAGHAALGSAPMTQSHASTTCAKPKS